MHFHSRRILYSAFGSFRLHFLPWSDAQKYVVPSECVFPPMKKDRSSVGGHLRYRNQSGLCTGNYEWMFAPGCQLRNKVVFNQVIIPCGFFVAIPPETVYLIEHISSPTKREKFEQCCVILQADYSTMANTCKNKLQFTPFHMNSGGVATKVATPLAPALHVLDNEQQLAQHTQPLPPTQPFLRPISPGVRPEKEEAEAAAAAAAAESDVFAVPVLTQIDTHFFPEEEETAAGGNDDIF